MTFNSARFRVTYDGSALSNHEMDVRELAPALLAISDALEASNRVLNGENARVSVRVRGSFQTGSFDIDFAVVQSVFDATISFLNSKQVTAAANLAGLLGFIGGAGWGVIKIVKWIRGRPIRSLEPYSDTDVKIITEDGDSIVVEEAEVALLQDLELRRALDTAIAKPLARNGVDLFATRGDENQPTIVEKAESDSFRAPVVEDEFISETSEELTVQAVSISFQEDNKWRLTDGTNNFFATINDDQFIFRVQSSELHFAKGDFFRVRLRRKQWFSGPGGIKTEYFIDEVIEHRPTARQIPMPLKKPSKGGQTSPGESDAC